MYIISKFYWDISVFIDYLFIVQFNYLLHSSSMSDGPMWWILKMKARARLTDNYANLEGCAFGE